MESKELARLKDIDTRLKGIELQLRGQNKILKELVDQIMKIADVFDKQWHGDATATINGDGITQWHGDATATINGDGITVTPYCGSVEAIDKIAARRIWGMDISGVVEEAKKGDTNEIEE